MLFLPDSPLPLTERPIEVDTWTAAYGLQATKDIVIEEVPVAIVCNGISQAVMLASPSDLEDFGVGFALTEGIIETCAELRDIELLPACDGIEVRLTIGPAAMDRLKRRRRLLSGRTGCGLCGVESLQHAVRPVATTVSAAGTATLHRRAIARAYAELARRQDLHRRTGAAHAAGFADFDGELLALREDVGRHNALDKLIGMLASTRTSASNGFIVVTSRASYEMVQKAAHLGTPVLAALSAPTALAIDHARACGMTLVGFAGRGAATVYTCPNRLTPMFRTDPDVSGYDVESIA